MQNEELRRILEAGAVVEVFATQFEHPSRKK